MRRIYDISQVRFLLWLSTK